MAIRRSWLLAAIATTASLASPASAQQALKESASSPPQDESIVVTGSRVKRVDDSAAVLAMSPPHDGQMARFESPVCPHVLGLSPAYAAVVTDHVRSLARKARIPVAKRGCAANLLIVVADDPSSFIAALRNDYPLAFAMMGPREKSAIDSASGPAIAWRTVAPRRADGGPVIYGSPVAGSGTAYMVPGATMSRLSVPIRQQFTSAYIVLDAAAIDEITLAQLGGYAAMIGLTGIAPDRADPASRSILSLFSDRSAGRMPPPEETDFDRAYLDGLYHGSAGLSAEATARRIARSIRTAADANDADNDSSPP
jgi:hypothetical protein